MTTKIYVGIDYSMSSPSICIHNGNEWSIENCKFYFLTSKKKHITSTKNIVGEFHAEHLNQEHRFDSISNWALSKIPKLSVVYIENYAFAAKGVVYHIGECCGLLKHKLWKNSIPYSVVAPSEIKKYATTKGNANKILMHDSFFEETKLDLSLELQCKMGDSPMSDIIDSYYISKLCFFRETSYATRTAKT